LGLAIEEAIVKTIRKSRAREAEFGADSAVVDIDHGALLRIKSAKAFPPKFHEETGDLWAANISTRMLVVDDHTEEGEYDGAEFNDRFDLKVDLDVLDELGLTDEDLKNPNRSDFTKEQREALVVDDNWTIRDNTKPAKLNLALFGKDWAEGRIDFHPDLWVDREIIAKVTPRTGKKPGSYTEWNTYINPVPPKKKKKNLKKAQQEAKAAAQVANDAEIDELPDLTDEDEKLMNQALG
jgi:hypothetical protein